MKRDEAPTRDLAAALALPSPPRPRREEEEFNPAHEFELHAWVPIDLGPLDLSINKAVVYLCSAGLTILLGIVLMRIRLGAIRAAPDGRRADLRHRPDADRRAGAPDEGDRALVPVRRDAVHLHLGRQHARLHPAAAHRRDVRDLRARVAAWGIYAATSPISVTLALALDDVRLHALRGDPLERRRRYFKTWIPRGAADGPVLIVPLEISRSSCG